MTLHEAFGKFLAAFQYGSGFGWTDDRNGFQRFIVLEVVIDTFYQRVFRSYYYHVDTFFQYQLFDGIEIVGLDGYVFAYFTCSGISRSDV